MRRYGPVLWRRLEKSRRVSQKSAQSSDANCAGLKNNGHSNLTNCHRNRPNLHTFRFYE